MRAEREFLGFELELTSQERRKAREEELAPPLAEIESLRRTARFSRANREIGVALELERIADERERKT